MSGLCTAYFWEVAMHNVDRSRRVVTAVLTLSATMPVASVVAEPAQADITCPAGFVPPSVNADCYFVNMMARDNIQANSQADLISGAHAACAEMAADTGADPVLDEVP